MKFNKIRTSGSGDDMFDNSGGRGNGEVMEYERDRCWANALILSRRRTLSSNRGSYPPAKTSLSEEADSRDERFFNLAKASKARIIFFLPSKRLRDIKVGRSDRTDATSESEVLGSVW